MPSRVSKYPSIRRFKDFIPRLLFRLLVSITGYYHFSCCHHYCHYMFKFLPLEDNAYAPYTYRYTYLDKHTPIWTYTHNGLLMYLLGALYIDTQLLFYRILKTHIAPTKNAPTVPSASPSPKVSFFPITYQHHIRHSSPHT